MVPHWRGPKAVVDNWQFSGTVFHSTGLPFSVTDSSTATNLSNYGGPLFAMQTASLSGHNHCGGESATATIGNSTPCSFTSDYASASDFGQSGRNQMFGPNYTDSDFAVFKGFGVPGLESGKLKVGAPVLQHLQPPELRTAERQSLVRQLRTHHDNGESSDIDSRLVPGRRRVTAPYPDHGQVRVLESGQPVADRESSNDGSRSAFCFFNCREK